MGVPQKQRPTFIQALTPFIVGLVVGIYGLIGAIDRFTGTDDAVPIVSMLAFSAGALLFAIGIMLLLVVIARPFFAPRPQDEGTGSGT